MAKVDDIEDTTRAEEAACGALIAVLRLRRRGNYAIETRPDKANSSTKDVDFVLASPGQRSIAVEHTSLESFEGQRGVGQRQVSFVQKVALRVQVPTDTYYKLFCPVEIHQVLQARRLDALIPQVAAWITASAAQLKPHGKTIDLRVLDGRFTISLGRGGTHARLNGKLLPGLIAPNDLDGARRTRITRALSDKLPKLHGYAAKGFLTYLLLEDWDISLSNSQLVKDVVLALRKEFRDLLPYGISQVTSYGGRIVEAWLLKEGDKWSSRISNRGPFYEEQMRTRDANAPATPDAL